MLSHVYALKKELLAAESRLERAFASEAKERSGVGIHANQIPYPWEGGQQSLQGPVAPCFC
jgi:hypothetical protein